MNALRKFFLICATATSTSIVFANYDNKYFAPLKCVAADSNTITFENNIRNSKTHHWLGTPQAGDTLSFDFEPTAAGGLVIGLKEKYHISISHVIMDFSEAKTDGKNLITHYSELSKTNLKINRNQFRILSTNTRSSIDLRKVSDNNWTGLLINDIAGDMHVNSIQILSLNCKLSQSSWKKFVDFTITKSLSQEAR